MSDIAIQAPSAPVFCLISKNADGTHNVIPLDPQSRVKLDLKAVSVGDFVTLLFRFSLALVIAVPLMAAPLFLGFCVYNSILTAVGLGLIHE